MDYRDLLFSAEKNIFVMDWRAGGAYRGGGVLLL